MQKDKYRAAVEVLESYRANREGIKVLRKKLQRLALCGGPKQLTAISYDAAGGFGSPYHKGTMDVAMEMESIRMKMADRIAFMHVVEDALVIVGMGRQSEYYGDILIMRHVDGWSMNEIAHHLGYSSRRSIYYQYNKAMARFADAIGL